MVPRWTDRHTVASGVIVDVVKDPLEIAHNDGDCEVDFKPVLALLSCHFGAQLLQDVLAQRVQKTLDGQFIKLRIHDRSDGDGTAPWVVWFCFGLASQCVLPAETPCSFGETGGRPEAQGFGDEGALRLS